MPTLSCKCGASLETPAVESGAERLLLCAQCGARTRLQREPGGRLVATRLAAPVVKSTCPCGASFEVVAPDAGGHVRCPQCGRSFVVRKNRRTALLSGGAASPFGVYMGVSGAPGRDQDRAAWHPGASVGAVADGVTTSPRSAHAAEHVCREAPSLFGVEPVRCGTGGWREPSIQCTNREWSGQASIRRLQEGLLALRAQLVREGGGARGDNRDSAYETTLLAFALSAPNAHGERGTRWARCGEAGLVAIGPAGLQLRVGVAHPSDRALQPGSLEDGFAAGGGDTDSLPGHAEGASWGDGVIAADAWIVAGTDGFFGAFEDAREMFAFLGDSRAALGDADARKPVLDALHRRLTERKGSDDDVAFLAVPPLL